MKLSEVIRTLESLADPETVQRKRDRFGIVASNSLGIYQKDLKDLVKLIGPDNVLALSLFDTGIYEARLLCSKIFDPNLLTERLMEDWVVTFENWEICDSFCMGFFAKSQYASSKAFQWSGRQTEFEKRAGFAIMAAYGFAHKHAGNELFEQFLSVIEREAIDEQLYVKKAVNWALRNIGKRNVDLHHSALETASRIIQLKSKSAHWIARDALRELNHPDVKMLDYPREIYRKVAS